MSNSFTLSINTGNAAFQDGNAADEVARILRDVAEWLEAHNEGRPQISVESSCWDVNGNKVGTFKLVHKDN